ncbi:probable inactive serine/threonine-protein kinase fnkc [Phtheirospermum japonicum]|uniref:Probable inactive serine/threonine-protein kinase fnkc n=1 Tax=Phtheirospermum japonicum TaxID=374723 RepID=A0A830DFF2_9LAMI|nr:probable inactive serine/threonine-protein kinase fnkc [Phtheirospermum japonicum]
METRKASPAHYLVKMDSFSLHGIDKYETKGFQAGGYEWKLKIYPDGHGNSGSVTVNLALADTSALPPNWEVNVVSSICLFNHNTGSYNYALGFPKFIARKHLLDPSNGYLNGDKCVFGAEVFVNENKAVTEYVCLKNVKFPPYKRVFKIPSFPSLEDGWTSEEFTAGGHTWKISLYRNGYGEANGCIVSSFLQHVASDNSCASYTICLKNKFSDERNVKYTSSYWFSASARGWGWNSFIDIASLTDPSRGFIVNDCCRVEVEISVQAIAG